jgi:hypothetical protein
MASTPYLSCYLSGGVFSGATALDYAFIGGLTLGAAMIVAPLVTVLTKLTSMELLVLHRSGTSIFRRVFLWVSVSDAYMLRVFLSSLNGLPGAEVWQMVLVRRALE